GGRQALADAAGRPGPGRDPGAPCAGARSREPPDGLVGLRQLRLRRMRRRRRREQLWQKLWRRRLRGVRVVMRDRVGVGWRPEMAATLLAHLAEIDLFEVLADDYLDGPRRRWAGIQLLARQVPVVLHGTGL